MYYVKAQGWRRNRTSDLTSQGEQRIIHKAESASAVFLWPEAQNFYSIRVVISIFLWNSEQVLQTRYFHWMLAA